MKQHKDCNFSYAGLKTQVRLAIESQNMYVLSMENLSPILEAHFHTFIIFDFSILYNVWLVKYLKIAKAKFRMLTLLSPVLFH